MKGYADRELEDLVRSAFAEMMPQLLDEGAQLQAVDSRSEEEAVPGPIGLREASDDSDRPRMRILVGAAVIALVVAGLALVGRKVASNDSTNSPVSNPTATVSGTTTPTVDASVPVSASYLAPLGAAAGLESLDVLPVQQFESDRTRLKCSVAMTARRCSLQRSS